MRSCISIFFAVGICHLVNTTCEARNPEPGWIDLMQTQVWKRYDKGWIPTEAVTLNTANPARLKGVQKENGPAWLNGEKGRLPNLITKDKFGDCEIHAEFLIAKGSNAGIKFQEVYEIQILDSFGKNDIDGTGMGGIYPRADTVKGGYLDKGIAPTVNASNAAGEWNTLDVVWQSPRVNEKGEKIANAKVIKATLNGKVIHENVELKTPTGGNWMKKETATGSLMLQSDHGPTAWRNVRIKPLMGKP